MIVLVQGAVFALVYLFAPAQGLLGRRIFASVRRRRAPEAGTRAPEGAGPGS